MILGTPAPDIDYLCAVLEEEARLDAVEPRYLGARQRVFGREAAAPATDRDDGRGIQRRSNVVAYLGGLPQRL
jgi:hypothetical protein